MGTSAGFGEHSQLERRRMLLSKKNTGSRILLTNNVCILVLCKFIIELSLNDGSNDRDWRVKMNYDARIIILMRSTVAMDTHGSKPTQQLSFC